jgi:hypothetical protein
VYNYPPGGGYPQQPPPPSSMSGLSIAIIVFVVLMVVLGGSCVLCAGVLATVAEDADGGTGTVPAPVATAVPSAAGPAGFVRDKLAQDLEGMLRKQGIPATTVMCPPQRGAAFTCELAVGEDRAALEVKDTGRGYAFDVPDTAFLDGAKLAASFQAQIAAKIDPKLRVPCFTGTLMKKVGAEFSCDVLSGTTRTGAVATTVQDAKGAVAMSYSGAASAPKAASRVVEFVCPPGKAPGGAVRGGCVCGSEILGTACGAPGNFTDVVETPKGCRFTCN